MPRYDFYNTETGELVEYTMSWRDLDDFKLNNPHLKQQVSAPRIVGGTGDRVKTDAGFDKFKDLVLDKMDKTVLPGIKENVVSDFYLTPDYFEIDLATLYGSGFSIQPKFSQSAYFRFHNQSEIYKNLYFVGAGTHPGAGMPGVLSSAKVLDKLF